MKLLTGLFVVLLALPARAQDDSKKIYDEDADAKALIADAVAKAKKDNKRVLVVYGGNWCGWCHKLHDLLKKNRGIARKMSYEYELVMVDIGKKFDKNVEIVKEYGAKIKEKGVPYLTVLDGDGKVVTNQETGTLEKGKEHDPELVTKFLDKWVATPLDAEKVYKNALSRAAKEKKRLLVHFGAPW